MIAVVALLADLRPAAALAAGFEEEGVPLACEPGSPPDALALAHQAAVRSGLGLGIGGDAERLVLVLAAWPGRPYLELPAARARLLGQAAARVATRRPLPSA
ncbi:MAG: glycerol dehydratase reactivation factor [Thermoleophilia bacterium]|nr:glycerol dehydratase reactivation factor [Thermoleophilia bacterium]